MLASVETRCRVLGVCFRVLEACLRVSAVHGLLGAALPSRLPRDAHLRVARGELREGPLQRDQVRGHEARLRVRNVELLDTCEDDAVCKGQKSGPNISGLESTL